MTPRGFDKHFLVTGAGRNKKFVRFTDSERCAHFLGVLSLAAQSPQRGYLLVADGQEVAAEEIANEAGGGVTVKVAASALAKLKRGGVLERDDEVGAWFVHDWWEVNPDPRNDPGNAVRQARYRERHKPPADPLRNASRNATETPSNAGEVEVEGEVTATADAVAPRRCRDETELDRAAPVDRRLCRLFAELGRAYNPKLKIGGQAAWLRSMRLMRERDDHSAAEIERVIRWLFEDPSEGAQFWAQTIQAPSGLRDHFGALWGRMQAPAKPAAAARSERDQRQARRMGAMRRVGGEEGSAA